MAVTTRRRRARKTPQRLDPHPAGSAEAVRIVREYIRQQARLRNGPTLDDRTKRTHR